MSILTDPHPDPTLVQLFRGVRQDARSDPKPTTVADMAGIALGFDGGGLPLVAGLGGIVEVPFSCRIVGARMFATDSQGNATPVDATVDVRYSDFNNFPTASAIYDSIPSLSSSGNPQGSKDIDISNWPYRRAISRDVLQYQLKTFVGDATKLTLSLWVRKIVGPSGATSVTTSGSSVSSSGHTVSTRSS